MYEYLKGTIAKVTPAYVVIEVAGIGYRVMVANPYAYTEGEEATIYVYLAVRDDAMEFYGFGSSQEKELFMKLLGVSGIGPKSALAIMANPDHQGLVDAIASNNVSYLSKFPGIGKKTASRIVLELQDKVDSLLPKDEVLVTPQADDEENQALADALAALKALGYTDKDVKKVEKELKKVDGDLTTDQYLSRGLTILN